MNLAERLHEQLSLRGLAAKCSVITHADRTVWCIAASGTLDDAECALLLEAWMAAGPRVWFPVMTSSEARS